MQQKMRANKETNELNQIKSSFRLFISDEQEKLKVLGNKAKHLVKNDFLRTSFEESSVHGMAHVVEPKVHLIERFLWLVIICLSIYAAVLICLDQWRRYQNNPTVLSLETNYRNWEYNQCGITICSNYTNSKIAIDLVERLWGVTPNDTKFQYYYDYILTVATTRYDNFNNFEKYSTDATLEAIDMLDIVIEMKSPIQPTIPQYTKVITEMGLCQSSTKLYHFQNPFIKGENFTPPVPSTEVCRSIDTCKISVMPDPIDTSELIIFIHNENDVISGEGSISQKLKGEIVIDVKISISEIISSENLIRLSPERRKCLFFTESSSEYFNVYTENLCKITCRINAAIQYCGCRPFLYNIEGGGPVCTPAGLYCLSKRNWYDVFCNCPTLCETEQFTKIQSVVLKFFQFNKMLVINTTFPKNRIKRNVLFSFEDLLVSFGGAAALFLGFSFLSVVEFFYFLIEFLMKKLISKS